MVDIFGSPYEGGEYHVDVVCLPKGEVCLVFLGQCREVDVGVGEVHSLLGRDEAVVSCPYSDGPGVLDLQHLKGQDTVVHVYDAARLDDPGNVFVVDVAIEELSVPPVWSDSGGCWSPWRLQVLVIATFCELFIGSKVHLLARRDGDILVVLAARVSFDRPRIRLANWRR
jgi:hypothetical protein